MSSGLLLGSLDIRFFLDVVQIMCYMKNISLPDIWCKMHRLYCN